MVGKTCLFSWMMMKCVINMIKIWEVIKDKLGIIFYSEPVYEYKYLKARVREFDRISRTNFLGNSIPKENMHYSCIACELLILFWQ